MELESDEQKQLGIAERGKDLLLVGCRFSVSVLQVSPSFALWKRTGLTPCKQGVVALQPAAYSGVGAGPGYRVPRDLSEKL